MLEQAGTTTEAPQPHAEKPETPDCLLRVEGLHKSFGQLKAVDGVSFDVQAGEVFGLLGPNGAGKSTTMAMICGLLEPDSGTVTIEGKRLLRSDLEIRQILGFGPQELAIYPELTGRENLDFFGRLYGLKGALLKERIAEALELIGLTSRADDRAGEYSGGMKRRLNFGIALLHRPRLLILDEPTVGVDPQSRSHLLDCIRNLNRGGVAAIYASHYMEEVQAICDRVAIIDHGKRIAYDHVDRLLDQLSSELLLRTAPLPDSLREQIAQMAEIRERADHEGRTVIVVSHDQQAEEETLSRKLRSLLKMLDGAGVALYEVESHEPNLERLFLELTGRSLRD